MYLHVLSRLERFEADGARVCEVASCMHVEDMLLEVAVVAVELAAFGTDRSWRAGITRTVSVIVAELVHFVDVRHLLRSGMISAVLHFRGCFVWVVLAGARPGRSWGRRRSRSMLDLYGFSPIGISLFYFFRIYLLFMRLVLSFEKYYAINFHRYEILYYYIFI